MLVDSDPDDYKSDLSVHQGDLRVALFVSPERIVARCHQQIQRPADYWRRRREWWRAEAARTGCDWRGACRTVCEVHDWLDGLRRRS